MTDEYSDQKSPPLHRGNAVPPPVSGTENFLDIVALGALSEAKKKPCHPAAVSKSMLFYFSQTKHA